MRLVSSAFAEPAGSCGACEQSAAGARRAPRELRQEDSASDLRWGGGTGAPQRCSGLAEEKRSGTARAVSHQAESVAELRPDAASTPTAGEELAGNRHASLSVAERAPEAATCNSKETDALLVGSVDRPVNSAAVPGDQPTWYRDPQVLLTLGGYGIIAMLFNLLDEVTPLFGSTPRPLGGLGLSPAQLALPLAVSGAALVVSALGFPPLVHALGTLTTLKAGLWLAVPAAAGLAVPSLLPGSWAPQAVLAGILSAKSCAATLAFTASMIVVNTAAPVSQMGSVNGAGQTLASFVRALGPAIGGAAWGASLSLGPPAGQFLPFAVVAVAFLATQLLYRRVSIPGL